MDANTADHLVHDHGLSERYVVSMGTQSLEQEHRYQHRQDEKAGVTSHKHEGMDLRPPGSDL